MRDHVALFSHTVRTLMTSIDPGTEIIPRLPAGVQLPESHVVDRASKNHKLNNQASFSWKVLGSSVQSAFFPLVAPFSSTASCD